MTDGGSRYRLDAAPDYTHRRHAGNVGDVWKHCVLVEVLRRAQAPGVRVAYLESHAGEGAYELAPTGEWTEGIGRLWMDGGDGDGDEKNAVVRYLSFCRELGAGDVGPTRYPGSPAFAHAMLGPLSTLALWENDADACRALTARFAPGSTSSVRVTCADGLASLAAATREAETRCDAVVVLIDPPFTRKSDWTTIPDVLVQAALASERATLMLWYPLKSLTRPNAMIARLQAARVSGSVAELITTPLEHRRSRLNGSGMILVRPPAGTLESIAAAAPVIGSRCATRAGSWSLRLVSW